MSEINTLFNKSSKQLLSLAKTLKENNKTLEGRVAESLLVKRNVETIKKRKLKHKFSKHPDPLSSGSETSTVHQPVAYGYSESSLSLNNCNKSCDISVTHSEHSTLTTNFIRKSPQHISFSSTQSLMEILVDYNMEIEKKEAIENIPLKKIEEQISKSTNKLKQHTVSTKIRPITTKSGPKGSSNKSEASNAKRNAIQKKNIDHKLRNYLQRIVCTIEDIRMTMVKGIEPPDGVEDWERVRVRTTEFSSRFSRNYLYPLGREMFGLQEVTKRSGNVTNRTAKTIHQRLFSAHQIVLQAFLTYRSHMTTLLANALPEKLQYVIEQTYILCEVHSKFVNLEQTGSSRREALIEVLINRCNILFDKIQETIEKRSQLTTGWSPNSKLSLMGYKVNFKKSVKPKPRKKNALEARLSMYSIPASIRPKTAHWKKTVETLAKDKLRYNHVQSRYKTAGYKHRAPPPEKPTVVELPTKSKVFGKRSSSLLRNTPIASPRNEDNILTMVEIQKDKDGTTSNTRNVKVQQSDDNKIEKDVPHVKDCQEQLNNVKELQIQDLTSRIQGLCQKVCPKDGETMTQKQLEILLKGLLGMALDGKINNNNETGSKKNGFTLNHSNEVAQKLTPKENDEEVLQEVTIENDKVVENKKSLNNMVIKRLESKMVDVSEKIDEGTIIENEKNIDNVEEIFRATNKVEFDQVNIINTKKFNKGYMTKSKINKRRQTVTVSGAKNAQLICIRDEDSIVESSDASKSSPTINRINDTRKDCSTINREPSISNAQGDVHKNMKNHNIINATNKKKPKEVNSVRSPKVKISRLPKKLLKKLVLVPKTQALNVIQYKLQYNKFTKANHMYRKTSKVQPWVIVDRISDHLLNDLLLSVAREIHVDQILESLYRSEFQ